MARILLVAVALLLAMAASSVAAEGVDSIITQSVFNSMLPNRNSSWCPAKGVLHMRSLHRRGERLPGVRHKRQRRTDESRARRLLRPDLPRDHPSVCVCGGLPRGIGGTHDQFKWGYCFKEEINKATSPPYYGRGPIQLTGPSNYQLAGIALGADLMKNPDLMSTDPVISFKTAIWFWMTAQYPNPSCHDVILGNWQPTAANSGAGQKPGYGMITQIIEGAAECGQGLNDAIADRIGFYMRYCNMLGIGNGGNLERFAASDSESQLKAYIISFAVGLAVSIAVTAGAVYYSFTAKYRRWKMDQDDLAKAMQNLPGMPTQIDYAEIRKATNNFHETTKLGKGGFGSVYRSTLPAAASRTGLAVQVAVKKFIREVEYRRYNDFLAEVSIINRLRHKNIVPLIGWSYNKGEPLLVYEHMTNGSLDQHLFRRGSKVNNRNEEAATRHWETRYRIVRDIATGLHYVHHEHEPTVLHRDIKASNIMLDSTFGARLGDFGIACTVAVDRSSVTGVAGTIGYIAPDYAISHKATRQSDIYAFGVLILEIVTGKKSGDVPVDDGHITDWVWRLHQEGKLLEAADSGVVATGDRHRDVADEATRLLLLGLACTNPNPSNRPSMADVVQVIHKLVPTPEVPLVRPTFMWPPEDWRTRNSTYSTAMSNWERSAESTIELEQFSQDQPLSVTTEGQHTFHTRATSGSLEP